MLNISSKSNKLLLECLKKRKSDLNWIILDARIIPIDEKLGNELRDIVNDEFLEYGLEDSMPNQYGLQLEKLIDDIGRLFM